MMICCWILKLPPQDDTEESNILKNDTKVLKNKGVNRKKRSYSNIKEKRNLPRKQPNVARMKKFVSFINKNLFSLIYLKTFSCFRYLATMKKLKLH